MIRTHVVVVSSLLAAACTDAGPSITQTDLPLTVAGKKVADVHEVVRTTALGGKQVQRSLSLVDAPKDMVLELATLDAQGFATAASYRREGKKGKRYVELKGEGAARVLFSRGDDETVALPDLPVVLWSMQHHVKPPQGDGKGPPAPRQVTLLDLDTASVLPATLDVQGKVTPTAPPPISAADPPRPEHSSPTPFVESGTDKVATWCKAQAAGEAPKDAARRIALAVKPKLAPERAGGPPSALMAVQIGGGDQAGAALAVACLRAVGHPARVVTGTAGGEARSWAQVFVAESAGGNWLDVDPLDVDLEGRQALPHAAAVEGFPGPLTTALTP
ncbi:MAG: transglutaminase family protein [Deltaproteobacteria bacterium]|nr:transglutaminase family protein [Deltaproteobacteria bacterium]